MSPILAIEIGRYNSVVRWLAPTSDDVALVTVAASPASVRAELTRLAVDRVVIEACSPAGWVHDLCDELGLRCDVGRRDRNSDRRRGQGEPPASAGEVCGPRPSPRAGRPTPPADAGGPPWPRGA